MTDLPKEVADLVNMLRFTRDTHAKGTARWNQWQKRIEVVLKITKERNEWRDTAFRLSEELEEERKQSGEITH